jgi:hypothetical protein
MTTTPELAVLKRMEADEPFAQKVERLGTPEDKITFFRKEGYNCSVAGFRNAHSQIIMDEERASRFESDSNLGRCTADGYSCS